MHFAKKERLFWNRKLIYCSEITDMGHFDHFKIFSFPSPFPLFIWETNPNGKLFQVWQRCVFSRSTLLSKIPNGDEADGGNGMTRSVLVGFCIKTSQKCVTLSIPSTPLAHTALRMWLACQKPGTWPGDDAIAHLLHILWCYPERLCSCCMSWIQRLYILTQT